MRSGEGAGGPRAPRRPFLFPLLWGGGGGGGSISGGAGGGADTAEVLETF